MNLSLDTENEIKYFAFNPEDGESLEIESDSLITVSKFNVQKITTKQRNVCNKKVEPFAHCPISLFGGLLDCETILMYALTDGNSHVPTISLWKLKDNEIHSGIVLRIYQGSGRTLRFRNKLTNEYSDLEITNENICISISDITMILYSIEFPKRKRITESTVLLFNFLITEKKEPTDCIFDKVDLSIHLECYVCFEQFTENESVFYPHDNTHPICTTCVFKLKDEKCPMCRKEFVLFNDE